MYARTNTSTSWIGRLVKFDSFRTLQNLPKPNLSMVLTILLRCDVSHACFTLSKTGSSCSALFNALFLSVFLSLYTTLTSFTFFFTSFALISFCLMTFTFTCWMSFFSFILSTGEASKTTLRDEQTINNWQIRYGSSSIRERTFQLNCLPLLLFLRFTLLLFFEKFLKPSPLLFLSFFLLLLGDQLQPPLLCFSLIP